MQAKAKANRVRLITLKPNLTITSNWDVGTCLLFKYRKITNFKTYFRYLEVFF